MDEPEVYDAIADDFSGYAEAEMPQAASTASLALVPQPQPYTNKQLDLIKQTVARGTSDLEFDLFVEVCHLTGLSPFAHQIYAVMRNASEKDEKGKWQTVKRMTIQTGIDGYLAIASRTHEYAGMDDVVFDTEDGEHPTWARVTVYRLVQGQRMPFTATARWREYVQVKDEYDGGQKTGKKLPTEMWARMPWTMLGKCARALALRLAFPAEIGGVYTAEEMMQADNPLSQTRDIEVPVVGATAPASIPAGPTSRPTARATAAPAVATPIEEPPTWAELGQEAHDQRLSREEWSQTVRAVTGKNARFTDDDRRKLGDWLKAHRKSLAETADAPSASADHRLEDLSFAGAN